MRSIFIALIILAWVPVIFFKPHVGVLVWDWISHMNPHRYAYGFAYDFPFLNIVAAVTVLGMIFARDKIRLAPHPILFAIALYFLWTIFTALAGYDFALSQVKLIHLAKVLVFALIAVLLMRSPNRLKAFVIVMGLSLAFVAVKGGLYSLYTGLGGRVQGAGGMMEDNNQLAMAMAMMLPVSVYFVRNPPLPWLRWPLIGVAATFVLSALGTHSRGGLAALVAVVGFMLIKSRRRFLLLALLIPVAIGGLTLMPDSWRTRMASIEDAGQDESFRGRVSMWKFAVNVVQDHPLEGGGFRVFEMERPIDLFMPYGFRPLAPHSIYFEVLSEHGHIGLILFLTMLFTGWYAGGASARRFRGFQETRWLGDMAEGFQLGLVGYAVGGLTVNIATFDLFYHFLVVLVMIDVVGARMLAKGATPIADVERANAEAAREKRRWSPTG